MDRIISWENAILQKKIWVKLAQALSYETTKISVENFKQF